MLDETGCAGVSIGRGAFYDPWIFKRTQEYLKSFRRDEFHESHTSDVGINSEADKIVAPWNSSLRPGELPPEPSFSERVRVMCRHLDLMVEVFGEELGCRMFRKVAPWYAKRFGPCHEFNKHVVRVVTREQFHQVLADYTRWRQQFLDENGELFVRFQPAPLMASFMRESDAIAPQHIPVPKGPVEVW